MGILSTSLIKIVVLCIVMVYCDGDYLDLDEDAFDLRRCNGCKVLGYK